MELLIATSIFIGIVPGFILGMVWAGRLTNRECEVAYLTGHVDGYRKAEDDAWTEGLL
jgi:hypothetical protein